MVRKARLQECGNCYIHQKKGRHLQTEVHVTVYSTNKATKITSKKSDIMDAIFGASGVFAVHATLQLQDGPKPPPNSAHSYRGGPTIQGSCSNNDWSGAETYLTNFLNLRLGEFETKVDEILTAGWPQNDPGRGAFIKARSKQ